MIYTEEFKNVPEIETPVISSFSSHVFHQYTLKLNISVDRAKLQEHLIANGIPSMIYYPVPLHLQKAYANTNYHEDDFPVTEKLCKSVLSLPMHTELTNDQLVFITKTIKNYLEK